MWQRERVGQRNQQHERRSVQPLRAEVRWRGGGVREHVQCLVVVRQSLPQGLVEGGPLLVVKEASSAVEERPIDDS